MDIEPEYEASRLWSVKLAQSARQHSDSATTARRQHDAMCQPCHGEEPRNRTHSTSPARLVFACSLASKAPNCPFPELYLVSTFAASLNNHDGSRPRPSLSSWDFEPRGNLRVCCSRFESAASRARRTYAGVCFSARDRPWVDDLGGGMANGSGLGEALGSGWGAARMRGRRRRREGSMVRRVGE